MRLQLKITGFIAILTFLGVLAVAHSHAQATQEMQSLTVLAETSLILPLTQIARHYSLESGSTVNVSFASIHDQAIKVTDGEPADIFISSHPSWINQLKSQGLIDVYSHTLLARNRLVLAGNGASALELKIVPSMKLAEILTTVTQNPFFVVGDPEFLAVGMYAGDALQNLGMKEELEPITLKFRESSQMINMISDRGAYGLIYATDAINNPNIKIIDILPAESYPPIQYEAVVVAGQNMEAARALLAYLQSPFAASRFKEYGFEVPETTVKVMQP